MAELIAERVFQRRHGGEPVIIRLFAPRPVDSILWSAKVQILGLSKPFEDELVGEDAFQALYLSLRTVCRELEKVEADLTFNGFGAELPIIMPWAGDVSLKGEVYQFILDKIGEALRRSSTRADGRK